MLSTALSRLSLRERARIDFIAYAPAAWTFPGGFHSKNVVINRLDPVTLLFGPYFDPSGDFNTPAFVGPEYGGSWPHDLEAYLANERYWSDPNVIAVARKNQQSTVKRNLDKR